jgi:hypothetical protein
MSTKTIVLSIIAFVLLALYVVLIVTAIVISYCSDQPVCLTGFSKVMSSSLATIGGLVSALVVAELAMTKPKTAPVAHAVGVNSAATTKMPLVKIVTLVYLGVWVLAGLAALLFSWFNPDALQPLTDIGQSWLGVAIAAIYAFFGIDVK